MKLNRIILVATPLVLAGAGSAVVGGYFLARAHHRRMSGRPDLGFISCNHCHQASLNRLPWAKPRPHHDAPGGIVVSPDGKTLFVALDDIDEVAAADVASLTVTRRAKVPGGPFGLALDAAGNRLFVACPHQDRVAVLDTRDLKEQASIAVGIRPTDVAYCQTPAGERLIVPNSGSNDISVLSVSPLSELVRAAGGREPYAVAVSGDGRRVYVANRMAVHDQMLSPPASEVTVLDPANGHVLNREQLYSAHLAEGITTVPTRGWMLNSMIRVRNLVPITQVKDGWVMSTGLAVSQEDGEVTQIPLDEANAYFSDPSGIVASPDGKRAYVASGGADVVTILDLARLGEWLTQADAATRSDAILDMTLSYRYVIARIPTGCNPKHLALSPDGRRLFVAERLDDRVLVVDTTSLKPVGRIVLGDGGRNDPIRQGERVFTRARYTFQGQFSCRSCHPDGQVDGLSYDFDGSGIGDSLLDNRSLCGVAGTDPFKWNGKNPTLQFQDGPRFARVLMRTDPIPSPQLDELATFLEHLPPTRTIPWSRVGQPLTPAEERGRKLFFATQRTDGTPIPLALRCQTCHRPPLFTDRLLRSVGTKAPRDASGMFDTPHLIGIGASAPYLHDGRAKTLEEIWTTYQKDDLHGVSSYWSKEQLNDLVEYLKTL
jgi:DNA-binding beta-propeller fold protein YncE